MKHKYLDENIRFDLKFALVLMILIAFNILVIIVLEFLGLHQKIF